LPVAESGASENPYSIVLSTENVNGDSVGLKARVYIHTDAGVKPNLS
jgi:hypothetical protein